MNIPLGPEHCISPAHLYIGLFGNENLCFCSDQIGISQSRKIKLSPRATGLVKDEKEADKSWIGIKIRSRPTAFRYRAYLDSVMGRVTGRFCGYPVIEKTVLSASNVECEITLRQFVRPFYV